MITLNVTSTAEKSVPVYLTKVWTNQQVNEVLQALQGAQKIAFFAIPPSEELVRVVVELKERGCLVYLTDNHDIRTPKNQNEFDISWNAKALRENCNALVSFPNEHLTTTSLVAPGDYSNFDAVVADPGPDGFWSAMIGLGHWYGLVDLDVRILESEKFPEFNINLMEWGNTLAQCMAAVREDSPKGFQIDADHLWQIYTWIIQAFVEVKKKSERLDELAQGYQKSLRTSMWLLQNATHSPSDDFYMVDVTRQWEGGYDLVFLLHTLEQKGAKVTIIRQNEGEIAKLHRGIQYRVQVSHMYKGKIDLMKYLPPVFFTGAERGIITEKTDLIYVNEEWWNYMQSAGLLIA